MEPASLRLRAAGIMMRILLKDLCLLAAQQRRMRRFCRGSLMAALVGLRFLPRCRRTLCLRLPVKGRVHQTILMLMEPGLMMMPLLRGLYLMRQERLQEPGLGLMLEIREARINPARGMVDPLMLLQVPAEVVRLRVLVRERRGLTRVGLRTEVLVQGRMLAVVEAPVRGREVLLVLDLAMALVEILVTPGLTLEILVRGREALLVEQILVRRLAIPVLILARLRDLVLILDQGQHPGLVRGLIPVLVRPIRGLVLVRRLDRMRVPDRGLLEREIIGQVLGTRPLGLEAHLVLQRPVPEGLVLGILPRPGLLHQR